MTLFQFALHNLRQRPARSLLTVAAVALGVAAAVALTGIAWGFEASWQQANEVRGTDLIVTRLSSRNAMPAPFPAEPALGTLRQLSQVQDAVGLLSEMLSIEAGAPPLFVFGWTYDSYLWRHLQLVAGRWPASDSEPVAMLGALAADMLHKQVGDLLEVEGRQLPLVGIFASSAVIENGALLLTLSQAQQLTDKPGKVNVLNLRLSADATPAQREQLRQHIRQQLPGFTALTSGELVGQNSVVRIAKAMSGATLLIAGLVGTLMVFNTMLMGVQERTREIGILLALGWRRRSVLQLVGGEAALLALAGGVVGVLLGVGLTWQLEQFELLRGKIHAVFSPGLLLLAPLLATVTGLVGGLYPAWRAASLSPAQALRQE